MTPAQATQEAQTVAPGVLLEGLRVWVKSLIEDPNAKLGSRVAKIDLTLYTSRCDATLLRQRLRKIQEAEKRVATGKYGKCAQCDGDISPQRLGAIPWTESCLDCANGGR